MKTKILFASTLCLFATEAVLAGNPSADGAPAPSTVSAPAAVARESAATPLPQAELLSRLARKDPDVVVLDVRTPAEFAAGHVPGARNLSHDELPARIAELASLKDKEVVLYCRSGRRTAIAAQTLRAAGFTRLLHLEGDFQAWQAAGHPTEK